jgi:hypothetical protein
MGKGTVAHDVFAMRNTLRAANAVFVQMLKGNPHEKQLDISYFRLNGD